MMRCYPAYWDSGVEWLGEMPVEWGVRELKRIASMHYGDALASDIRDEGGDVVVYGSNGPVGLHSEANAVGPAILVGRKGSYGALNWSERDCFAIDTVYFIDGTGTASHLRWLFYALHLARFEGSSQDTGVPGLSRSIAYSTLLPFPPLAEQTAIAAFLDRETAKIDALVEEQRRLIALLREKRQAVISHAVTKGLNPAAPLKPSGVDWLGDVPSHWPAPIAFKHVTSRVVVGIAEAAAHAYVEDGVPILRSMNIRAGKIIGDFLFLDPDYAEGRESKRINAHDLVTVRTGHAGVTAVVPEALDGCQCFTMLVSTLKPKMDPEYFCLWMNSESARFYFSLEAWGSAQPNISVPILEDIVVCVPPYEEQVEIVTAVASQTAKIDILINEAASGIALLQERRAALISAAITGKIDVRDLAPVKTEAA